MDLDKDNYNNHNNTDMDLDKDNYLSRDHYCTQCKKSFTRVRDRIRHENSVHKRLERFACSHCEKTFTRRDSKVRHEHQCLRLNTNDNNNNNIIKQEKEEKREQHCYCHQIILPSPSPPPPSSFLEPSIPLSKSQPNKPLHMNPDIDVDEGLIRLPPIIIDKKQQDQFHDNNSMYKYS